MEDMHSVKLDGYESAWNEGGFKKLYSGDRIWQFRYLREVRNWATANLVKLATPAEKFAPRERERKGRYDRTTYL
jgi:hypothetical protein